MESMDVLKAIDRGASLRNKPRAPSKILQRCSKLPAKLGHKIPRAPQIPLPFFGTASWDLRSDAMVPS